MALLNCECGHELWWKEPRHVLLFFDDLETSGTYGERVTECPGCGRRLTSGILRPVSGEYSAEAQQHHETV